ncbi:MAG: DegV family protein [Bacilli bacterium]|nr:DegV family protein [Bacilli bacterium]
MSKIHIFIDSTGDLQKEFRDEFDIDYLPMTVSVDDKQIIASLDYDQGYSLHDFYEIMRNGKRIYTSQVSNPVIEENFRKALVKGEDILYIACSGALSASVRAAEVIATKLRVEYPGRTIICFDPTISGYAQGEMAIRASKMRAEGKSIDEIYQWLDANKWKFNQFGTVESLKYLKQAGRVSAGSAFFGNLLAVKPIIISNRAGENLANIKVKGQKKAWSEVARLTVEAAEDVENKEIWIGHADNLEGAEFVKEEILKLGKPKAIHIGPTGPIIGASSGPGTVITYVYGKEVTI